jgi:glyoxylase-like metal-dependent hydrolase (beta-lactamase superfamily II)
MPVLVLRQAVARGTTLRHMGRRRSPAGAEDVVSFSNADGSVLAVGIDTATARLTTVETIGEIGLFGDGDHVWRFGGYERSRGILVPRGFQHRINGLLQEDMQLVHVAIDPAWGDTSFGPPAGYALRPRDPGASRPPGVVDSGGGVYFVEGVGGSRTMFVDMGDGIVAVEAPQSTRVAEQTIALIEQTRPGKPITHLVLTHHHLDHVGGVRAFVERGATVIVPHGMDDYLRRIIGGTRTFGTLGEAPRPAAVPTIESVADRRRIGSVEVVHATTAHAAHTLVVYVPSRRLLFQGDRLRVDGAAESPRVMQAAADLASVIERYALDVRTIGSVHGANATIDDLRTVLRSRAASRR